MSGEMAEQDVDDAITYMDDYSEDEEPVQCGVCGELICFCDED